MVAVQTLLWRARQALRREFASLIGDGVGAGPLAGLLVAVAWLRRMLASLGRAARHGVATATSGGWATAAAAGAAVTVAAATGATLAAVLPSTPPHATLRDAPSVAATAPAAHDARPATTKSSHTTVPVRAAAAGRSASHGRTGPGPTATTPLAATGAGGGASRSTTTTSSPGTSGLATTASGLSSTLGGVSGTL